MAVPPVALSPLPARYWIRARRASIGRVWDGGIFLVVGGTVAYSCYQRNKNTPENNHCESEPAL